MKKVVLFSGTLCDEQMWTEQVYGLNFKYEVIIPDISGYDTVTEYVENFLVTAPGSFHLVGFSLGGIIALEIMRLAPERVEKLVLIGTNSYPPNNKQFEIWDEQEEMVRNGEFIEITQKRLLPILIDDVNRTEQLENQILQMAKNVGEKTYIQQLNLVRTRGDQRKILPTIQCPTLLIVGENDVVCPPSLSEYMQESIVGSELEVISNGGHLITMENGKDVTDALCDWL